jgi:hypothetical protein
MAIYAKVGRLRPSAHRNLSRKLKPEMQPTASPRFVRFAFTARDLLPAIAF